MMHIYNTSGNVVVFVPFGYYNICIEWGGWGVWCKICCFRSGLSILALFWKCVESFKKKGWYYLVRCCYYWMCIANWGRCIGSSWVQVHENCRQFYCWKIVTLKFKTESFKKWFITTRLSEIMIAQYKLYKRKTNEIFMIRLVTRNKIKLWRI